jgi:hypothetical protein
MQIQSAKYFDASTILAIVDGNQVSIPASNSNRIYRAIVANGITVEPVSTTPTSDDINQERDRRIAGGFVFGGNTYQSDPESRQRIANAAIEAIEAIIGDVSGGNLRWSDPDNDFTWRAADNSEIPMDAPSMVDLHKEARAHEALMIRRAQALKANPPSDYTDDSHWI